MFSGVREHHAVNTKTHRTNREICKYIMRKQGLKTENNFSWKIKRFFLLIVENVLITGQKRLSDDERDELDMDYDDDPVIREGE